jgi:hypothetical protein
MLYVGLDLSRKRLDFDALLPDGTRFERGAVAPDADGLAPSPIRAAKKQHECEQAPNREIDKRPNHPQTSDSTTEAEANHREHSTSTPLAAACEFAARPNL